MKTIQLENIYGGAEVLTIIDGACAIAGLGSLFGVVTAPVAIGCGIYGVVRWATN